MARIKNTREEGEIRQNTGIQNTSTFLSFIIDKTSFEELCSGLPNEFQTFFEYCRSLRFDDCPDYLYLRGLFSSILQREVSVS